MPAVAVNVPVVPEPAVTELVEPNVVELVVTFWTVPATPPVRIAVVNWSVSAIRLPPKALVRLMVVGAGVSADTGLKQIPFEFVS